MQNLERTLYNAFILVAGQDEPLRAERVLLIDLPRNGDVLVAADDDGNPRTLRVLEVVWHGLPVIEYPVCSACVDIRCVEIAGQAASPASETKTTETSGSLG